VSCSVHERGSTSKQRQLLCSVSPPVRVEACCPRPGCTRGLTVVAMMPCSLPGGRSVTMAHINLGYRRLCLSSSPSLHSPARSHMVNPILPCLSQTRPGSFTSSCPALFLLSVRRVARWLPFFLLPLPGALPYQCGFPHPHCVPHHPSQLSVTLALSSLQTYNLFWIQRHLRSERHCLDQLSAGFHS
jgi:hypothetical protein